LIGTAHTSDASLTWSVTTTGEDTPTCTGDGLNESLAGPPGAAIAAAAVAGAAALGTAAPAAGTAGAVLVGAPGAAVAAGALSSFRGAYDSFTV
jgi:hypothetical protein